MHQSSAMLSSTQQIGPIEQFMTEDHVRIDRLLAESESADGSIDLVPYGQFRHDLLRHIGMEEKVLLPFARDKRAGEPLPIASTMRADHGEIVKLLVRSPTPETLTALREIFVRHNPLEEGPEGLYAACDALAGDEAASIVAKLHAQPRVPVAKFYDGPMPGRQR